jgi:hypothetical protein
MMWKGTEYGLYYWHAVAETAFRTFLEKECPKYVIPPKEIDKLGGEKRDDLVSEIKNRELILRKK